MKPIEPPDAHHLNAAQGWLELGNWVEALADYDKMSPAGLFHPDALKVRWHIYEKAKEWQKCADIAFSIIAVEPDQSFGWIHVGCALYELKQTQKAFEMLAEVAEKFSDNWSVPYNLAFYCSRLDRAQEAREWLRKAFSVGDANKLKGMAKDDPYLRILSEAL